MSAGSRTSKPVEPSEWRPGADRDALRARARMLADLREHFAATAALEVETPLLCIHAGTDPAIEPLTARYSGPPFPAGMRLALQTSPEFAMKRLLAAGSGAIFQICKAFRDGEAGRLHNPEFTLLEWYRPGVGLSALIDEVVEVARLALDRAGLSCMRVTYGRLFADQFGIDIVDSPHGDLRDVARQYASSSLEDVVLDRDGWLDLLFSHWIQPELGTDGLCVVTDYPASQAALARRNPDGRTAARFELFYQGVELANGFDELIDADEQAARFADDNAARRAAGQQPIAIDQRFLTAMRQGLPDCVGVAMGLDRLLMLRLGRSDLDSVLSFSLWRC